MRGLLLIGAHHDAVAIQHDLEGRLTVGLVGIGLIEGPHHFVLVDLDDSFVRPADAHVAAQVLKHHVHFAFHGLLGAGTVIVLLAEHLQAGVSERREMHAVPLGRIHAGTHDA